MKKRSWILIFGLAVLLTACMIFFFSAQDGATSSQTSGSLAELVLRALWPNYNTMTWRERQALFNQLQLVVRKAAHFTEFALLGLFLRLLFSRLSLPARSIPAWLAGTLYAMTDEWHQMFVGQRAATWLDVGIDSAGVFFGVALAVAILVTRKRKREKQDAMGEN